MVENNERGKKVSLENIAYEELKNAIIVGIYPPGSQIVEEQIAHQLDISRSPVRIAIKRLESEGFLDRYANKRIYVAFADAKRTMNVLYIREALEGMAARLAAINRTEAHIEQLNNLFAAIDISQHENKTYEQYVMGVDLHRILFAAANNPQLERIGINTLDQESVFSYRSLINDTGRGKEMNDEHRMIAKYVIEQNPDKAEEAARYHIRQLIDRAEAKQPMVHYNSLLGNKLY